MTISAPPTATNRSKARAKKEGALSREAKEEVRGAPGRIDFDGLVGLLSKGVSSDKAEVGVDSRSVLRFDDSDSWIVVGS